MKQLSYTITDPLGIHERPADLLVKAARALDSAVTVEKADGKSASAVRLMAVMGLSIKQGDTISVTVEGGDEEASLAAMEQFSGTICKEAVPGRQRTERRFAAALRPC